MCIALKNDKPSLKQNIEDYSCLFSSIDDDALQPPGSADLEKSYPRTSDVISDKSTLSASIRNMTQINQSRGKDYNFFRMGGYTLHL